MKHIQSSARTIAVLILLVIVLAFALRPLLPWLFAVFILGWIIRIAIRDP